MHAAIVDPSRVILKLIAKLFKDRGDTVSMFVSGEEALKTIIKDTSINVLLTSFEVGALNGLELCWHARLAAGSKRPLFIMVMSSLDDEENVVQALDSGADELIVKPISRGQLNARLRMAARLQLTQMHLIRLAETDPLTGLLNRRALLDQLNACLAEQGNRQPLSAIMIDIDFFKRVNDSQGHQAGDKVLAAVADQAARCGGIAGRLGGEEFVLILRDADKAAAFVVAEDLRLRCSTLSFRGQDGPFRITCSCGIAQRLPDEEADSLLHRADIAMYSAKNSGRNCTRVAEADSVARDSVHAVMQSE
jgi:diguanylate cyclase (GGDEF)-like protein